MKRQQQEVDEVNNLSDLFKNQTRYTNEYFSNIVNQIRSLLDDGLVVEVNGRIEKPNGYAIDEYKTRVRFDSYHNNLQDTSDIDEWKFTGTVKIVETNIRFNKDHE